MRPWLLCLFCAALAAIDPPTGVVAVQAENPEDTPGGSAVVVAEGLALTLSEVLPAGAGNVVLVVPPGRRREATVERRGAVALLRFDTTGLVIVPAATHQPVLGDTVWTAGNAAGAVQLDGIAALSRGTLSGRYQLDPSAPVRGRAGKVVSTLDGEVFETDAAVNDGMAGGALLDAQGRLLGLVCNAQVRERRLGTAVPAASILAAAGLPVPAPAAANVLPGSAWTVSVRLERTQGLGNPPAIPRPSQTVEEAPPYERERLQRWWDLYYHAQQVFWNDAPVPAVVIDPAAGFLLTSLSNLHGAAEAGRVLVGAGVPCRVHAVDAGLDLALLKADAPLDLPAATFATAAPALGAAVRALGRIEDFALATTGHISVTGRRVAQTPFAFLQTDARANYACLGGPLVDAAGNLAGMVVLLGPDESRPWYINSGVAMAVDAPTIAEALPRLRAGRSRLAPPVVGLGVGVGDDGRLTVRSVRPGTGAAAAGMKPGDRIVSVDGVAVASPAALARVMLRHRAGDTVTVDVRRGRGLMTLRVDVREFGP
jgi:S1-C subfamily serine protease